MTNKKTSLLLFLLIFLTYANALGNGFIGDDNFLFLENNFYKNPRNLSKLFSKDFITKFSDIDPATSSVNTISTSGCVSYRLITALSFFIDNFFWKLNPHGFHLTNIVIHFFVSCLVYTLSLLIIKNENVAFFASLLFAVHPIQTEVVNNIGYRSDLLVTLFYLLAVIGFIKAEVHKKAVKSRYVWPLSSFFIALFSKETAITLPIIFVICDYLFLKRGHRFKEILVQRKFFYIAVSIILAFYLFIYFIVIPNSNRVDFSSFHVGTQILIAAKILFNNLLFLFWPPKVTVLPTLYAPPLEGIKSSDIIIVSIFLLLCAVVVRKSLKNHREISFSILWFLVTYLPSSNLIPLPNPWAFRFMYLPSVGFFIFLAIAIEKGLIFLRKVGDHQGLGVVFKIILVGFYMINTIPLNEYFRNDQTACQQMLKNYPDAAQPYKILGEIYYTQGHYNQAIPYFRKYLEKKSNNPFVEVMKEDYSIYHQIGVCFVHDPDKAIIEFKKAIALRPDYALAHADLAVAYLQKGEYSRALEYALHSIDLQEQLLFGYIQAIKCYLKLNEPQKAEQLWQKVAALFPNDKIVEDLHKMIQGENVF